MSEGQQIRQRILERYQSDPEIRIKEESESKTSDAGCLFALRSGERREDDWDSPGSKTGVRI